MTVPTCEVCSRESRRGKRFCSERCREIASGKTCTRPECTRPVRAKGLCSGHWKRECGGLRTYPQVPCSVCGGPALQTSTRDRVVCSTDCRWFLQWPTECRVWYATCEWCSKAFVSGTSGARWCSPEHRALANRKRWPSSRVFFRDCVMCGHLYATRFTVTVCSKSCATAKMRQQRSESKYRRRVREREAFVERVPRREIFERDQWRCHLCGKKVRRTAVAPHPLSPTLDHVIPLAQGGTHERANVRTAHYLCNATKSDGCMPSGEQLMLIG